MRKVKSDDAAPAHRVLDRPATIMLRGQMVTLPAGPVTDPEASRMLFGKPDEAEPDE